MVEKYSIDGREVIIIDKCKAEKKVKILCKAIILKFCSVEEIARYFPVVFFELGNSSKLPLCYVSHEDLDNGKAKVNITIEKFQEDLDEMGSKEIRVFFESALLHEFTHLFQNLTTGFISRNQAAAQRLIEKIEKKQIPFDLKDFRVNIRQFLTLLLSEGVATFSERYNRKEVFFSERYFNSVVRTAVDSIKSLKKVLALVGLLKTNQSMILKIKWEELFSRRVYELGFHMVYSILYIDHEVTVDTILNYELFEFIRKYEQCIIAKGTSR